VNTRNTHDNIKPLFVTTPTGTAQYPRLNSPDTRFDEDGIYKVNLVLEGDDAKELLDKLNAFRKNAVQRLHQGKSKPRLAVEPWDEEVDEDTGEPTGRVIFKCKQKAVYKKDGQTVERRVQLIGADAQPTDEQIGGGSLIKCALMVTAWNVPALGIGVSLKLRAVQVLKANSYSGDASSFGFRDESGVRPDAPSQVAAEDADESDEDFDF
jgi:hypothetical protein